MRIPPARAAARATAAAVLVLAARTAAAQCPAGAACYFGTDETGSSTRRPTNVQALAARTEFFTRLTGVGTQSFDGLADGTATPLALAFAGAGTATLTGSGAVLTQLAGTDDGRYAVSGAKYMDAIISSGNVPTFAVDFASPVAAFGFYGADVGEFGSSLALRFTLVGGGTQTWVLPYAPTDGVDTRRDGSLLYAGFVGAHDFTRVEFVGSGDDYFGLDDVSVGARAQVTAAVVPEPATAALLAGGLALAGAAAARRRTA